MSKNKFFLGLITRCKDEFFVKEFCDYYISQGVEKIYIIDDNSMDKSIYNNIDITKVTIIYDKCKTKAHNKHCLRNPNCFCNRKIANTLYMSIRNNFEWIIYCDVDEFITTKKNINNTIKKELETTFKDVDCIKIPWVMMGCNKKNLNPESVLLENTYRWNQDIRHNYNKRLNKFRCRYDTIECKCIFKSKIFKKIIDHYPLSPVKKYVLVNSIDKKKAKMSLIYNNLREDDIENGYLLCYHYRIISIEHCKHKLQTNDWYIKDRYTLKDLIQSDRSEVKDETLKNKVLDSLNLINNLKKKNILDNIKMNENNIHYISNCKLIEHKFKNISNTKKFLGLITRCKNEVIIKEFCEYYLSQGVDDIYILDDNSDDTSIYDNIKSDKVHIYYAKNNTKAHKRKCGEFCSCNRVLADKIYKTIKHMYDWMIYVDVDEFITTKKYLKYTIKDLLQNTYKNMDCISVPWIMMSAVGKDYPQSVLQTNIYRVNYDNKPNHTYYVKTAEHKFSKQSSGKFVQCKSIFKCNSFNGIHDPKHPSDHHPVFCKKKNPACLETIENKKVKVYCGHYNNLTETKIKNATLVCYHYRVICEKHAICKLTSNNWYILNKYSLQDLMKTDQDINDTTLKNKVLRNSLKFVHITKTSGTYIEDIAYNKNILWGRFDKNLIYLKKTKKTGAPWHYPIIFNNIKPYTHEVKLFTIVRNPYERIISECLCRWGTKGKKINTKQELNIFIKKQVLDAYNLTCNHFTPQYLYTHSLDGKQKIDYIIKYENMEEFNKLMKKYNIDIKYKTIVKKKKKFSIKDIDFNNIDLINKVYDKDFKLLGYKKTQPPNVSTINLNM